MRVVAENVVTDRQTDGQNDRPSTVTLTAHVPWINNGLVGYAVITLFLEFIQCEFVEFVVKIFTDRNYTQ